MTAESQLLKTINQFIGPCAHGIDPYDRCEECEWLSPIEAKVVALNAAVERLSKRLESEPHFIYAVCHYRNLAIVLGAKPDQMLGRFDRELCEGGLDPNDTSGDYHVSVNQQLDELKDVWAEVERLKESVANLDALYVSRTDALRESEAEVERLREVVRKVHGLVSKVRLRSTALMEDIKTLREIHKITKDEP